MPFGDGTGPSGLGPRTGRGTGYCAGYNVPGYMNPQSRFGGFGGRGRGRGFWARSTGLPGWYRAQVGLPAFGWGWPAAPIQPVSQAQPVQPQPVQSQPTQPQITKEQELQLLSQDKQAIEQEQEVLKKGMEEIKNRIKALEGRKK